MSELQKDVNKTTIEYNPNSSIISEAISGPRKSSKLLQTAKSADYDKEKIFDSNFDPKINQESLYVQEISDINNLQKFEVNNTQVKESENSSNKVMNQIFKGRDARKRLQNLSSQIFDNNGENQSYLINKNKSLMERTFDHKTSLHNLSESKPISLTEENLLKNKNIVMNYNSQTSFNHFRQGVLEKKRMSTEQLMHISPETTSPAQVTEK